MNNIVADRKKPFYGWINLAILWFSYGTVVASISYAFGVVVNDMADNFDISMTIAMGAYTGYTLVHAASAPLAGQFINRFGAKASMILGLGCLTVGCLLLGFLGNSVWFYYLFWIFFVGFGLRFGTLLPEQVNISKWFFNYRGMAMALLLTAGGIGGYIFTPLCTKVNDLFGWRYVWIMIAAFSLLSLLLTLAFVRESPEKYGLQVDGGSMPAVLKKPGVNAYKTSEPWKLCDARKTPAFMMLIVVYFAASYQLSMISSQAINHLELQGVSRTLAASAVGMFAFINTSGRIIVGVLGDRVNMKKIVAAGSILSAAGFLLLMYAGSTLTVYVSLILSGIGYGIMMVAPQNMLLNYFGSYDYANINGLYSMLSGGLAAIPPVVVGWFYDISGSYQFAWILGICLMAGCLLISVAISPPAMGAKAKQSKM